MRQLQGVWGHHDSQRVMLPLPELREPSGCSQRTSLAFNSLSNPFGLRLGEVAGDLCRCSYGCPDHRSHYDLAIKDESYGLADVVPSCGTHLLSSGCV
jgi:hypothetical protein